MKNFQSRVVVQIFEVQNPEEAAALARLGVDHIGVLVGEGVSRVVSPIWLRRIAGGVFIVLGVLFLVGREG